MQTRLTVADFRVRAVVEHPLLVERHVATRPQRRRGERRKTSPHNLLR